MKKRLVSCCLLFTLCVVPLLASCGKELPSGEALAAFGQAYPLPAGTLYHSAARQGEEGYMDPRLFHWLYGREDGTNDREDVAEFSLFLGSSLSSVYETGVFISPDGDGAKEVMGMLHARIQMVKETPHVDASAAEGAFVAKYGKTVVYAILPDNPKAKRVWERILS